MEQFTFTVQIPTTFDVDFIEAVISTAFEGGSNYWIDFVSRDKEWQGRASDLVASGGVAKIHHNGEINELTREKFIEGYKKYVALRFSQKQPVFTDPADIDADEADVILQFAALGEIVYG